MENKTPTALELFQKELAQNENGDYIKPKPNLTKVMIEFAKLHVEAALKEASEDANMDSDYYQALQVYPLTNIK